MNIFRKRSKSFDPTPTPMHAHEITSNDAAFIRMMSGAIFGPDAKVVLPSGKSITGSEMALWLETDK